ncbi:sortase [Rubrobacter tropicus]|nr:sortase [Rubrobacter tropicus]
MAGVVLIAVAIAAVLLQLRAPESGAATTAPADRPLTERSLKLTVPAMERVREVPVFDAADDDESALRRGVLHSEDTGMPWEAGANVYIAGHRLGYPRTRSFLVFWDLNVLKRGDRVILENSDGTRYLYEVFDKRVVPPDRTSVKEPVEGKSIVSLQTCTLPDYSRRLVVRAELVKERPAGERGRREQA